MKGCARCGASRTLTEFGKDRSRPDGLHPYCKPCRTEVNREVVARNPEKRRVSVRAYAKRHPERRAEAQRRWREKNPDWSAKNNREWRERNPGAAAAYHAANRDRARARYDKRRALKLAVTVGEVDLDALWATNAGRCQLCSEPIDRDLRAPHSMSASVDHIVPLSKGGTHEQSNLQWTHLVCNKKKGARLLALPSASALTQGA